MTAEEMYQKSIEKIENFDFFNEIVLQVQEITSALKEKEIKDWTGDELSRALSKLAILRVNLGEELSDATAKYDFSYLYRKIRYANEWKPTKKKLNETLNKATVADTENAVLEKIEEDQRKEVENKHYADKLKILYDSTETLITALQSRLGVLKQERREASRY
jgi:hypothetical protein